MNDINNAFQKQYSESMQNSAKTLDGHIANENAVTNDYRGRAIYEFFQNAIDRAEGKIWVHLDPDGRRLIIANDGESFSIVKEEGRKYSDFESLCSINTSSKNQDESIGNKGVGFKSCWEYTSEVSICSVYEGRKWGFKMYNPLGKEQLDRFASDEIKDWLIQDNYLEVVQRHSKVPSFYFPERLEEEDCEVYFTDFPGAVTVIVFHDIEENKVADLEEKIEEFASHQIFFVQQLEKLQDKNVELNLSVGDYF